MTKRLVALLGLLVLALTGCAGPVSAPLPDGVTASLFQNRFDYSLRQIEIKVVNGSTNPLTVTRASLESNRFAEPAVWDRPQLIPAGSARDLKVVLARPVCDGREATVAVDLDFELVDGTAGTATIMPTDETGRIEVNNELDCLGISVAEIATIAPPGTARWTPGAHAPAIVDIAVTPTGASGQLTIQQAKGTVLLGLVDETGAAITTQPLDLVVDASAGATVIRLRLVPSRCDPHAVAEDKRGTFFPLDVSTDDGRSGTIYVGVSDAVRGSLYEFFSDYCGLP
ncbi:MAG: hypothetical protein JWP85_1047 [Rhodoglobus sp.]|nr:hypothetical protein [Rhodoglobus sp.]